MNACEFCYCVKNEQQCSRYTDFHFSIISNCLKNHFDITCSTFTLCTHTHTIAHKTTTKRMLWRRSLKCMQWTWNTRARKNSTTKSVDKLHGKRSNLQPNNATIQTQKIIHLGLFAFFFFLNDNEMKRC